VKETSFAWVGSDGMVVIDSALVVMIIVDILESSSLAPLRIFKHSRKKIQVLQKAGMLQHQ
jgi:hypothetical protein